MKKILLVLLLLQSVASVNALIISEIMSNPIGDDGGREWIEIYNDGSDTVDISTLSISIKGGNYTSVTNLQGGVMLSKGGYAIISSVVSNNSKFLQDYSTYTGLLFKSSISLVNTGVTSIDIKISGSVVDSLSSYTAAKEGATLGRVSGSFVVTIPTPGSENQAQLADVNAQQTGNGTTTDGQATILQTAPPSSDIVIYMPSEKIVVAGVAAPFSVFGLTKGGKTIDGLVYTWAYGDGGSGVGSTTLHTFAYPGRYVVTVEGTNGYIVGNGRTSVRVVLPEIVISKIDTGKYGSYIDIVNPNNYDLDLSQWKLVIDGGVFLFPKNTTLASNSTTHIIGSAMGFASTTFSSSTVVRILFPTLEEVTRFISNEGGSYSSTTKNTIGPTFKKAPSFASAAPQKKVELKNTGNSLSTGSTKTYNSAVKKEQTRDTRIVSFFKTVFNNK
jgi:hypothetical protein